MALPKAVRLVGTVGQAEKVYVEDYVLQYLTICEEETESGGETVLYGRKEREGKTRAYLIYGIYRQTGQDRPEKKLHGKYGRLGYINPETGAIVLDDWGEGRTLEGYYVFYDADEKMKDFLGDCYERQLRLQNRKKMRTDSGQPDEGGMETPGKKKQPEGTGWQEAESMEAADRRMASGRVPAELVALCRADGDRERMRSPFLWIRMAVLCIFIVFCAIAVTTVNGFDKLNDFIQTAVLAGELMDNP